MSDTRHYLFTVFAQNDYEGEDFLVGAADFVEAIKIVKDLAEEWDTSYPEGIRYCGRMSDFEAEASGLDEY